MSGMGKWPAPLLVLLLVGPGCAGTKEEAAPDLPFEVTRGLEYRAEPRDRACSAEAHYLDRNRQGHFALIPENPRPGEPVTLAFAAGPGVEGLKAAELLNDQGRRLSRAAFFPLPPAGTDDETPSGDMKTAAYTGPVCNAERVLWAAVLTVPVMARAGSAAIRLEGIPGPLNEISLTIGEREFAVETIKLDQRLTDIRSLPDPQKTAEAEQLWAILSRTGTEIYCSGAFVPPVASTRRTSFFGDRRIFQYANGARDSAIHAGVDFGVPVGTPVSACGPGKVVLARHRIVTGNSIVLEHLPGVYSLYYHLDTIAAGEGDRVDAGTVLGRSGATGLATGPHLHWEIRVSGENTDPDAFIARPLLDKKTILARIDL
ncbi:MAG: M23 family metallopeptidase [Treponema sp.]|jgi:murein DD-endopeptidase MepM/ murein hydrolase activator NlpD|nr:M23 family metallopeptidase [Treponema sp.]